MRDKNVGVEYHFIINPQARSGRGALIWNRLSPELKKRGIDCRIYKTERARQAQETAAQITADGKEHTIVVLGGDGTVNEVVNGIRDPEKVTLGYIPVGSGNDFARGLGIPKDPEKAFEAVLAPKKVMKLNIGQLVTGTGKSRPRRFAVSSGIGFDAGVCHEVCVSRWKSVLNRIKLGKLSYAVVALDRLKKDRPARVTLTFPDGSSQTFDHTYFAAFMNLKYEGGGFMFCPDASCEDGMMDVLIAHGLSPLKIVLILPTAFLGKHVGFKGVSIVRCSGCRVESDIPLPVHADGEPLFPRRTVEVSILDKCMRVITG